VVEHLPSKWEALSSNPNTAQKKGEILELLVTIVQCNNPVDHESWPFLLKLSWVTSKVAIEP
jgi:hypothetical protein